MADPIVQVSSRIADCPVPARPETAPADLRAQTHGRVERGTTCYVSGHCRLPNTYLYDPEIIARVKKAIDFDGRFADISVWAEGQRRWVWLKGCVRRQDEADALERLVRSIDDVQAVVNELVVKAP